MHGRACAAALLLVVVLFKLIFAGFNDNPAPTDYEVPNLLGKTMEEALQSEIDKGSSRHGGRQRPTATITTRRDHAPDPSPAMCAGVT